MRASTPPLPSLSTGLQVMVVKTEMIMMIGGYERDEDDEEWVDDDDSDNESDEDWISDDDDNEQLSYES